MSSKELPEEVRKAFEELKALSKDPAMREVALSREIALRDHYQRLFEAEQRGIEIGREEGREEGKKDAIIGVAKQMMAQGLPVELIQSVTGLSVEEIELL